MEVLGLFGAVNLLIWLSVLIFPEEIYQAWQKVTDINDRLSIVMIGIVFGIGVWITYTVFRIKSPEIED